MTLIDCDAPAMPRRPFGQQYHASCVHKYNELPRFELAIESSYRVNQAIHYENHSFNLMYKVFAGYFRERISKGPIDDQSTVIQVMAWCRQVMLTQMHGDI